MLLHLKKKQSRVEHKVQQLTTIISRARIVIKRINIWNFACCWESYSMLSYSTFLYTSCSATVIKVCCA